MSPNNSDLDLQLKTLWGASRWPGFSDSTVTVPHAPWENALRRLHQLAAVRSSGLVHGPHGVGKSFLIHRWTQELSSKQFRVLRNSHSSLMGNDLLRNLLSLAGQKPCFRRGDNVLALQALWKEWSAWPLVIIEEAQDLNAAALEELRLLTTTRDDTQMPFSLILVGDEELLPRLELGINRGLLSRLSFSLVLNHWPIEALDTYLRERLAEVGINASPLEPAAQGLLLQSAHGRPRTLNALLQRSMEAAALDKRRQIQPSDVQAAMDTMPWVARENSLRS